MFRDDYNNEMNKLSPDAHTKNAILEKLQTVSEKEYIRKQNRSKIIWRAGAVAVACAIVLAVVFIPRDTTVTPQVTTNASGNEVLQAVSYNDIYKTLNKIYHKQNNERNVFEKLFDFITGGGNKNVEMIEGEMVLYERDYATTDDAVDFETDSDGAMNSATKPTTENASPNDTAENTSDSTSDSHTETNTQVAGVDEADIVKTDGKYIYALYHNGNQSEVRIIKVDNGKMTIINKMKLEQDDFTSYSNMYLANGRLCLTTDGAYYGYTGSTEVLIIDVSDPAKAKQIGVCEQNGGYQDSRLIGNSLYLISNYYLKGNDFEEDAPSTYVPCIKTNDAEYVSKAEEIRIYSCDDLEAVYTVVCAYNITDASLISTQSVLGRTDAVYCSTKNLLTARGCGVDSKTGRNYSIITRFSISGGKIEYVTDNRINGTLLNQFSMDESEDGFRFVTTVTTQTPVTYKSFDDGAVTSDTATSDTVFVQTGNTSASLYLLDHQLKPQGKIEDLAPGERVYSVRFMGDTAYFVTFRETDPLFSADLSDPENPKILGQLKIPGFSNYLFPYGDGQLLGLGMEADPQTGRTECVKLSMFDINDPANVTEHSKYLIDDSQYSAALYDHKASLIDTERNIIGFSCSIDVRGEIRYRIYSCENEFKQIADLPLTRSYGHMSRGIIIGDILYLVEGYCATSYSLKDFTQIQAVIF